MEEYGLHNGQGLDGTTGYINISFCQSRSRAVKNTLIGPEAMVYSFLCVEQLYSHNLST